MVDPLTTSIVGWGFSAAGWLISPILIRLLNKCFDALGIDLPPYLLCRKHALFEKLEKLQTILLPQLLILTEAAQQSPHRPLLKQWLQKLRYAFYEAEHVLGLVEYKRLEKEVNSFFPLETKFNVKKVRIKLFKFSSEKKKLVKSLENIEKIVNEATDKLVGLLNLSSNSINNSTHRPNVQYRETTSTSGSMVIGRDKDRDEIVKLLRENLLESSSNANCYSVIGIWGMGGSGKTTLAQYVCEYEKEANYFDLVIWAHVSQTFNVHAILKKISESAFMEPCPDFSSLEGLQSKVEEKLRGQRYFMVLDDAWCDKAVSEQEVEQLFAPLKAGKRGSKILVTSRIEEAAIILGAMNPIPLNSWEPVPLSVTELKLDRLPLAFARKKDIEMLTSTRISRISDIVNFLDNTFGDNAYAAMEFNFDWVEEMMELSDNEQMGLVSLKTLFVWNCPTIVDLHIGHLKSLVCLFVRDCPNIVSLRGCSELKNLYSLDVTGCRKLECYSDTDKLPHLNKLYISRFSLVAQLISISGFSSLVILRFYKVQQEYFSPEECEVLHYLSSLEELYFLDCKLRSLPPLLCLLSLKKLDIRGCVNLILLPELPPSAQTISILECNEEFTRSCKDTSHPNWHKISHIPKKNIEP
ncbi:hypothetical protein LUZ63_000906 [Rhynchospora breviuscula]|uniref:NB-ARC domain-containing protein n=1 Tax=Rhynchospora breviuscula TaxID=2022672 RepID=A0A9Q0HWJ2_9POAL|nr:hypothetical protein LUZ63_000906 [Rhynchospora breviuscula]